MSSGSQVIEIVDCSLSVSNIHSGLSNIMTRKYNLLPLHCLKILLRNFWNSDLIPSVHK